MTRPEDSSQYAHRAPKRPIALGVLVAFLAVAIALVVVAYSPEIGRILTALRSRPPANPTLGPTPPWPTLLPSPAPSPSATQTRVNSEPSALPPSPYLTISQRLGFCAVGDLTSMGDITRLGAGWYVDYTTRINPARPAGIEFVQTVSLHQLTQCWPRRLHDRDSTSVPCTYTLPCSQPSCTPQVQFTHTVPCAYIEDPHTQSHYTYTVGLNQRTISAIASANPGALWTIGNEPDRRDSGRVCTWGAEYGPTSDDGQDEMLPEVYAEAYHDLYARIKLADPTARVAIGGIIQATPARLQYLTRICESYKRFYGMDMPVDVWNVHNFIIKERCDDYGADVPPGYAGLIRPQEPWYDTVYANACYGTFYNALAGQYVGDNTHDSMEIFAAQIRAFRLWMKEHGQKEKPLIVSEYGFLYHHILEPEDDANPGARERNQARVTQFMLSTSDYFLYTTDSDLGYSADGNRLVQRWAWFSLNFQGFNEYNYLYDPSTRHLTPLGEALAAWVQNHQNQ
jgi:hypothetical protein